MVILADSKKMNQFLVSFVATEEWICDRIWEKGLNRVVKSK